MSATPTPSAVDRASWWCRSAAAWLATLDAGPAGLTSDEAARRRARSGPNIVHTRHAAPLLLQFLARFRNPLVLVLLLAAAVSGFTGEATNAIIIGCIVCLSVVMDFVQEFRAGRAADRLAQSVSVRAAVLRDGTAREIPAADIVPGDVVMLAAGDLVPADGVLLDAKHFFVKQALLTGEPYPAEKEAGAVPGATLEDARGAAFMGTSVISGSAKLLVVETGTRTAIGAIADTLARRPPPTAFEQGTRGFGLMIMRLTFLLVLFVLLVNAFEHKPLLEIFLFAVALAVGLTPELLPMVVSVTLARGALAMARARVIVKRLAAIQDLGSMDVLCTDKTGTLTEARIELERHVDPLGRPSERVLELAYLNSFFETGLKSPLDEAILEHRHIDVSGWRKIDEVPFDFERRRVSVLVERAAERVLVAKGAPEDILGLCSRYEADRTPATIDAAATTAFRAQREGLEREGFRVLAIAWRGVGPEHDHADVGDESELVFAGYAAFFDPPKESAKAALAALAASGVAIKIVSGDSELVTQHVCAVLGLPVAGVLTGREIAALDEPALQAKVEGMTLFCRVNPTQKERVIRALRARGHVVGYLGDGINDAPPLHAADVGLSVDSAVDVAKEAADMILLEHDLRVLHAGVLEGRRTFANIMKYIMMGTSSNFGNMFSMAGASLFLPFLPMLPTQILLNNILYDVSEVPIPLDRVEEAEIALPRALDIAFIRDFMIAIGPVSSLFDFLTFYVLLFVLHANEALFQTGWFVESLATQVLVIFVIRAPGNPLLSRPHPVLAATSFGIVAIAALLPFTPLAPFFGFVAPPPQFYAILVVMVVAYLAIVEGVKRWFFARRRNPRRSD
ncbi:MAG: magnesium-translocating P-type ATPase [Gammaproteobacteria bacterium]|nr:magnesium-translocating P-type ATPase [Gammaproteobacteria bacterium]